MVNTFCFTQEDAHPRDARVCFEAEPHVYWIDGERRAGTSATQLARTFSKPFNADEAHIPFRFPPARREHRSMCRFYVVFVL